MSKEWMKNYDITTRNETIFDKNTNITSKNDSFLVVIYYIQLQGVFGYVYILFLQSYILVLFVTFSYLNLYCIK